MELCHCGSQKQSDQCCIPTIAPIHCEIPRFIRYSKIFPADLPFFLKGIKINYRVEKGPGILSQIDPLIAEALGFDMTQEQLSNPSPRNTLIFPLHAARYHMKQFMFRLRLLQKEIVQEVRLAVDDPRVELIQCEDIPLRSELEAFISRLAAYLDAHSHFMDDMLSFSIHNPSHYRVKNKLLKETGKKRLEHQAILETYELHEEWIRKLFDIRHEVMHEGIIMDMSIPADFFETKTFIPRLKEKSVEELVTTLWSNALIFTKSLINLTINEVQH